MEYPGESIRQKLVFLIERLELAFMHDKHRRYSSDLLLTCVLWENTSSNQSKQMREEGLLTFPSQRYIQKLFSAISMDTGLTRQTARAAKLNERVEIVALLMDEVYVSNKCEFTRSNGRIYEMEKGEPTKTLLTIMYSSVAADYQDVIAMIPTTKVGSTKINNLLNMVLNSLAPLGYKLHWLMDIPRMLNSTERNCAKIQ